MPGSSPGGGKTRAITAVHPMESAPAREHRIPVLGNVAAGEPILAQELVEDYIDFDAPGRTALPCGSGGESMIGAGILPGDLVIVRRQPTAPEWGDCHRPDRGGGHLQAVLPPGRPCLAAAGEPGLPAHRRHLCPILGKVIGLQRRY